jgi:hypothetical protein
MNLLRPRTHRKPVVNQLDGHVAGFELEHWDDHQDATAFVRRPRVIVGDGRTTPGLFAPGIGLVVWRERRPWRGMRDLARSLHRNEDGTFGTSGMYVDNYIDVLDGTQLAIDTSLTTHKWALYTDTLTPNFSTDVSYSATNEVTGTGYTAGGQTIVSPTTTESPAGTLMYDMTDQVWVAPTTVTARGGILYADVLGTNNLIVAQTFGGDIVSTAGTFTIAFNALGVFTIDLTP